MESSMLQNISDSFRSIKTRIYEMSKINNNTHLRVCKK
jgi:hypothetical protein